jgi:hypothetical protein
MAKNKGIGHNEMYTAEEVDALLAQVAAGGAAGGFSDAAPLTYSTPEATTSGGKPIGASPDGLSINRPPIVAGIPVVVDGKRYQIALIAE